LNCVHSRMSTCALVEKTSENTFEFVRSRWRISVSQWHGTANLPRLRKSHRPGRLREALAARNAHNCQTSVDRCQVPTNVARYLNSEWWFEAHAGYSRWS